MMAGPCSLSGAGPESELGRWAVTWRLLGLSTCPSPWWPPSPSRVGPQSCLGASTRPHTQDSCRAFRTADPSPLRHGLLGGRDWHWEEFLGQTTLSLENFLRGKAVSDSGGPWKAELPATELFTRRPSGPDGRQPGPVWSEAPPPTVPKKADPSSPRSVHTTSSCTSVSSLTGQTGLPAQRTGAPRGD